MYDDHDQVGVERNLEVRNKSTSNFVAAMDQKMWRHKTFS